MEQELNSTQFKTGVVFAMTKMKNLFQRIRNVDLKTFAKEKQKYPLKHSTAQLLST